MIKLIEDSIYPISNVYFIATIDPTINNARLALNTLQVLKNLYRK